MVQLYSDINRFRNKDLIKQYYRYSKILIIEKINKYFGKIKNAYYILNVNSANFKKGSSPYDKYLKTTFDEVNSKINKLELELNNNNLIIATLSDVDINNESYQTRVTN